MTTEQPFPSPTPVPTDSAPYAQPLRHDRFVDDPRKKSVMLAILLSAMPGLGQVYVGYYDLGFRNILVICALMAMLTTHVVYALHPALGLFLAFFWLHNLVDAGRRASFYNQALAGLRPMDLPEDMKAPSGFGSLAGGIGLVVVGLILFTNTMFGVSLHWLSNWWPLGLVAVGGWLAFADWQAKQAAQARREAGPEPAGPGEP
jgi:hypothetical protein